VIGGTAKEKSTCFITYYPQLIDAFIKVHEEVRQRSGNNEAAPMLNSSILTGYHETSPA
jgi:hypothetical protein